MKKKPTFIKNFVLISILTILPIGVLSSPSFAFWFFTEQKVPGVYFVEFDASALIQGLPAGTQVILPSVYTIHADGSVYGVDGTDGGLGQLPGFLIQTPTQGVWRALGKRSIRLVSLYFGFLRPEDAGGVHGLLEAVSRLTANVKFDKDFNGGTGLACLEDIPVPGGVYDPDEHNPLDLAPLKCTKDAGIALPFSFKRLAKPVH